VRYPDKATWYRFYDELVARLRAEPNIIDATVASSYPGLNSWSATYRTRTTDVAADSPLPMVQYVSVMDNYADMLGMKLLRGRWFDERDRAVGNPLVLTGTLRDTVIAIDPEVAVFRVRTYDNWLWAGNFYSRSVSVVFSVLLLFLDQANCPLPKLRGISFLCVHCSILSKE
jgi:hypothetical protein